MISRIRYKICKILIKSFPLNIIRKFALLSICDTMGSNVYIGEELIIVSPNSKCEVSLIIGDRVSIGPRVTLILTSHPNSSKLATTKISKRGSITLGDDCWIGAGVIILPGIRIGKKAIVGAGSIVTKDVQENTIVAGNPAKVIS